MNQNGKATAPKQHEFQDDFSGCIRCGGLPGEPCEPPEKFPALETHACAYNDGKQTCDCFVAGFKAAQEEQVMIMQEQNETNERYLAETKARDERLASLSNAAEEALILRNEKRKLEADCKMMKEYIQSRAKKIPGCPFDPEAERIISSLKNQ